MKFRKKPIVIEAWQNSGVGSPRPAWLQAAFEDGDACRPATSNVITIRTLEGTMTADLGDWIIQGVKGELYPCKPDVFALTYEMESKPGVEGQSAPSETPKCKELDPAPRACGRAAPAGRVAGGPAMTPTNDRPPLTDDLTRCLWHPDVESVGWRNLQDENGGPPSAVGVCLVCAIELDGVDGAGGPCLISPGLPCMCGPGFCASERGVGYIGFCAGSRPTAGPDCPRCGAGHQSDAGCWLCLDGGEPDESCAVWLAMLAGGVTAAEVFDHQSAEIAAGRSPSFDETAHILIARKARR